MTNKASEAGARYAAKAAEIRRTLDRATRGFADAMNAASAEYEAAMTAAANGGDLDAQGAIKGEPVCHGCGTRASKERGPVIRNPYDDEGRSWHRECYSYQLLG